MHGFSPLPSSSLPAPRRTRTRTRTRTSRSRRRPRRPRQRPLRAAAASLLLAGCPERDKDDDKDDDGDTKKAKTSETTTTPPASTTPAPVTTETAPRPAGITPLVKAEVDNRADGIAGGQKVSVPAKAAIDVPAGWTLTKGETQVATSTDQKARVAVTNFGPEGPEGKLAGAATAAGLSNCQWAPPEPVTAGKDKLPGQVADGLCSRARASWPSARGTTVAIRPTCSAPSARWSRPS
jgi:hypothetical protein